MLQHIILQGNIDMRETAFSVADAMGALIGEGITRFSPLGIRTPRPGQEIRAFWSIPGHECAVRVMRDLELGVVAASLESSADPPFTRVVEALTAALPSVSVDIILCNEERFEEMPDLVFLLALATRHAPTERVTAIVERMLTCPVEKARVSAAGGAVVLGGGRLLDALKRAGAREDLTPTARGVFEACMRDWESGATSTRRTAPFKDPGETFRVRW